MITITVAEALANSGARSALGLMDDAVDLGVIVLKDGRDNCGVVNDTILIGREQTNNAIIANDAGREGLPL